MAAIPVNQASPTGADLTYTAVTAGGDTILNDGKTILLIHNTGSSCTVTVTPQKKVEGLTISAAAKAVVSGTDSIMGPFDPSIFNTAAGVLALTYSGGTATTTIAPLSL